MRLSAKICMRLTILTFLFFTAVLAQEQKRQVDFTATLEKIKAQLERLK